MAGLEFEPHNLYNLKIKNEETVAEVDSKWSSNYGSPLQSPPFEHWYFSMTFIVLCCTGIWGSSNRLCIGVCAKLPTRMKDGEHGVVLSTLVLAVASQSLAEQSKRVREARPGAKRAHWAVCSLFVWVKQGCTAGRPPLCRTVTPWRAAPGSVPTVRLRGTTPAAGLS